MAQMLRDLLARLTMRFSPARERYMAHIGKHVPILKDALTGDPVNQLLTLRIMDDTARGRHADAAKKLEQLRRVVRDGSSDADKALYCVLMGESHVQQQQMGQAARWMHKASRYNHRFHYPYLLLGFHRLFHRGEPDRAAELFDRAISCIYDFPPLDESKQAVIALMHAAMAYALLLMHRTEDARLTLHKAAAAARTEEYLHAAAHIHAALGQRDEAEEALAGLKKVNGNRHANASEGVALLLAGTHPHFTARPIDPEPVRAYWDWFVQEERTLRRLLADQGGAACSRYQKAMFAPLVPEPRHIDLMGVGFKLVSGTPRLALCACHSRTYAALIEALVAACPKHIADTWEIVTYPGGLPADEL